MTRESRPSRAALEALETLDVDRLVLAIHDASLPGGGDDDIGRGTPASPEALALAGFARAAGFDALQLGPQGLTDEDDASPYTGALFSRNPLTISLARLSEPDGEWGELLPPRQRSKLAEARPPGADRRVPYGPVFRAQRAALAAAFERCEKRCAAGDAGALRLAAEIEGFRREAASWLEPDALYEALRLEYGGRDWSRWDGPRAALDRTLGDCSRREGPHEARREELARRHGPVLRFYRFVQFLAHDQHRRFREETSRLGLQLFGDLQVGVSPRDTWRQPGIFLDGYRLGAPPSRTNPDGQPWDYPVLDPQRYVGADGTMGAALRFVAARVEKVFAEYDAVRIDHPQGLVCPWVYRADAPDALRAVQQGARLFSSPDLPDHPDLARYAIARPSQLNDDPETPRYDDHWVAELDDEQVEQYALLFDRIVEVGRRNGRARPALICEVLSTLPNPLARVLARHDLGRFRVTQKADLSDPLDVYRAENAEPRDWVMFGNHDTPPLWHQLEEWRAEGRLEARAAHAARCLEPSPASRDQLQRVLITAPGLLAHAEIAQLFASPARNVSIFFADLFGVQEIYNRPGTVSPENWSLRLAPDWREAYAARVREDRALNLPLALWLALRSRRAGAPHELLRALAVEAERLRGRRLPLSC